MVFRCRCWQVGKNAVNEREVAANRPNHARAISGTGEVSKKRNQRTADCEIRHANTVVAISKSSLVCRTRHRVGPTGINFDFYLRTDTSRPTGKEFRLKVSMFAVPQDCLPLRSGDARNVGLSYLWSLVAAASGYASPCVNFEKRAVVIKGTCFRDQLRLYLPTPSAFIAARSHHPTFHKKRNGMQPKRSANAIERR